MRTPLRELHESSGIDMDAIISPDGPIRSKEALHNILRRGALKVDVLEHLSRAYGVPLSTVLAASRATADSRQKS